MKILIVKLSSLGDVVHAMAAVHDLHQTFPQAQIDWVVESAFAPLVRRCAGVHRVIRCDLRRWRKSPLSAQTRQAWQAFRHDLQSQTYDVVLDLQGLSKSALVAWLARLATNGQRYAMANQTDGSGYEAPTRWVADVAVPLPAHVHAVVRSRQLCAQALHYSLPFFMRFGLVALASQAPDAIQFDSIRHNLKGVVALVHGTSRADKEWPPEHWQALAKRLNEAGWGVALLHGSDAEEARSHTLAQSLAHAQVWPRMALDALTDAMANCAGVIGVDSGLSHMAVALGLAHVQIYNFDTAWRTGPLPHPRQCSVYASPAPDVDAVWQAWLSVSAATTAQG